MIDKIKQVIFLMKVKHNKLFSTIPATTMSDFKLIGLLAELYGMKPFKSRKGCHGSLITNNKTWMQKVDMFLCYM